MFAVVAAKSFQGIFIDDSVGSIILNQPTSGLLGYAKPLYPQPPGLRGPPVVVRGLTHWVDAKHRSKGRRRLPELFQDSDKIITTFEHVNSHGGALMSR